jgi:hypothetical protein
MRSLSYHEATPCLFEHDLCVFEHVKRTEFLVVEKVIG